MSRSSAGVELNPAGGQCTASLRASTRVQSVAVACGVAVDEVPAIVRDIYKHVRRLEAMFPGRKFTPDGHLVGSIGEVLAAHRYGLELLEAASPGHGARAPDGRLVQVKTTQGRSVALRAEPEHLIVLRLESDGTATEVFNGPGARAWGAAGKMGTNGQRPISLSKLKALDEPVGEHRLLPLA